MPVLLPPAAPRPDEVPPTIVVNLDTANVPLLAQLVRAAGQPRPRLLIDCGALAQLRTLGLCHVVSRLLLLRRTGAGIALCNVSPGLSRALHLLRLGPLFLPGD